MPRIKITPRLTESQIKTRRAAVAAAARINASKLADTDTESEKSCKTITTHSQSTSSSSRNEGLKKQTANTKVNRAVTNEKKNNNHSDEEFTTENKPSIGGDRPRTRSQSKRSAESTTTEGMMSFFCVNFYK